MMAEIHEVLSKEEVKCIENRSKMESTSHVVSPTKLSHKQLKAARKKERRKIKRQQAAQEQDKHLAEVENTDSPSHQLRQRHEEEREKYEEECRERERQLQHALWLEREKLALEEIAARKRREEMSRIRQAEDEKRIREEWQERQRQEKEEYEKKQEKEKAKREKQDALLKEGQSSRKGKDDGSWHNPLAPTNYGQEAENCPFFAKTGACRFGEQCSRAHPVSESSCTLLFKGMYAHFGLMEGLQDEFDLDITLEYEDKETYHHFKDFYEDVLPEFKAIGKVVQFKVCCNYEPHLRGNVYVQFRREEDAHEAFGRFNARWYAGRQLQCEFCSVTRWKNAICGQFRTKKCPKGKNCNFLHVFRNPGGEFWEADRDYDLSEPRSERNQNWHNSDRSFRSSFSREPRRANWDRRASVRRSRSRSPDRSKRRRSRSPKSVRRSRSRSPRSVRRSRSRSPRRSVRRSRSRSPKHTSSSRNHRKSNRSRSRSPKRDSSSRSKIVEKRKRSRSRSPKKDTLHKTNDTWNSDSDSDHDSNTKRFEGKRKSPLLPRHNGSRHSPESPAEKDRASCQRSRSRSPSQGSTASKKHKPKKHKKDKKHKHSRSKKDSAYNDQEEQAKNVSPPVVIDAEPTVKTNTDKNVSPPVVIDAEPTVKTNTDKNVSPPVVIDAEPTVKTNTDKNVSPPVVIDAEPTVKTNTDIPHQTNPVPDKREHLGTDLQSNGSEHC